MKLWERSTESSPGRSTTNTRLSSPNSENPKLSARSSRNGIHSIVPPKKIFRKSINRRTILPMKISHPLKHLLRLTRLAKVSEEMLRRLLSSHLSNNLTNTTNRCQKRDLTSTEIQI